MIVGIPRALLYYKNEKLWTTFLEELGIDYIISPETNKELITNGAKLAIDETCLPTKVILGHINWLKDKCDYIFLPRIKFGYGCQNCTKFEAIYDLVNNTFREDHLKFLFYNINKNKPYAERKAFLKLGKFIRKNKLKKLSKKQIKLTYETAHQAQLFFELFRTQNQEKLLENTDKNKVLIIAHSYNVGDKYIGEPIIKFLKSLNTEPIIAEYCNAKKCISLSQNISKSVPWGYNKHLIGAIELLKDKVDGIVLLTTFPCGPDSMVNEMVVRKIKDIPIITLTVDTQDGTAGIETRLESFVDILNFKKENANE